MHSTGVLNVSSCRLGSPTFMSLPHFYNADPYYTNAVEGLKPEKDKHDFYFTLEPVCKFSNDRSAWQKLSFSESRHCDGNCGQDAIEYVAAPRRKYIVSMRWTLRTYIGILYISIFIYVQMSRSYVNKKIQFAKKFIDHV